MEKEQPLLVNTKQVCKLVSLSYDSIEYLMSVGRFPKPVDCGVSRNLWKLKDIEEWVESLGVKK